MGGEMYVPKAFEENRIPVLHGFMRAHPFVSLITSGSSGLFASHLPMVLEETDLGMGTLKGHVSRANPQWRAYSPKVQALVIFSGADHYITPSWYEEKRTSGKVVPTWNYAVVHASGFLKTIEDAGWLRTHLEGLVAIHEAPFAEPWKVSDAPEEYVASQVKGIVGLELRIERLEGKWKLNQNRSEADRRGVVEGLGDLDTPESAAMKEFVKKTL
jgi:transcriptional regulator